MTKPCNFAPTRDAILFWEFDEYSKEKRKNGTETCSLYIFTPLVENSRSIETETDETDANISAVGDPFARLFASKYTNTHAAEGGSE